MTPEERFESKIERFPNGCWIWRGALNEHGYGVFWVDGRTRLAHRWSYEQKYGPAPDTLDHQCDDPACVNPDHVKPSTRGDNVRRYWSTWEVCAKGHAWTPENTYIKKNGYRDCRACNRERARARAAGRA